VIGTVTGEGRAVVARSASETAATIHRRNEYLPETRVEAAFPLRSGERVIGALDLQSRLPHAFPDRDLPVFQTLADQLAIAIDNTRLFEETQRRLAENRSLLAQNEHALREVERYAARLTGQAWTQFIEGRSQVDGLSLDLEQGTAEAQAAWLPALDQAAAEGTLVQQRENGHLHVAVPLRVRGVTLGAMAFQVAGIDALSAEDAALAQTVGDRLGLALENARLFDESQRAAQRQALINEISTQLQASTNVEATLRTAAHSLQTTLGAGRVAIRLGPPPVTAAKKDGEV
jgi:GAF domain-containing protein